MVQSQARVPCRAATSPARAPLKAGYESLKVGAVVHRDVRVAKNARWYVASAGALSKVGWGDLSVDDLERVHADLGQRAFVAVAEAPVGARSLATAWGPYDQPDVGLGQSVDDVCGGALLAVLAEGGSALVDRTFRTGEVRDLPGVGAMRLLNVVDLRAVLVGLAGR